MLSLLRTTLVVLIAVAVNYVNGNQRVIYINELNSGEGDLVCCVYGNCSCNSLDHALASLTSDVLINITTDVTLSSLTKASNLESVSIIGHNNPTVNCESGGVHFTYCHNINIQGVTWDGCGKENIDTSSEPGVSLSHSSSITIWNCYFKYSIGQAVSITKVQGDVSINHCQFIYNSHYRGHGAAVHYSSTNNPWFSLKIDKCDFNNNKDGKSLVYIENKHSKYNNDIIISSSHFCHNQLTPIFVAHQQIRLGGSILFINNSAKQGAGIYISAHSTVIFGKF